MKTDELFSLPTPQYDCVIIGQYPFKANNESGALIRYGVVDKVEQFKQLTMEEIEIPQ